MAIGGNEANVAPPRARRRNSGSMKRQRGGTGSSTSAVLLVDYTQTQADLSHHPSLLPLEVLVNSTNKQNQKQQNLKTPKETLEKETSVKHGHGSFGSVGSLGSLFGSLSSSSHNDVPSARKSKAKDSSSSSDLGNCSEHSIQLEKVFAPPQCSGGSSSNMINNDTSNESNEHITFAHLTVTPSTSDEDKIQFHIRNRDMIRAVQQALEDTRSTRLRQRRLRTHREIKCHIPHDRFRLPKQVQMVQTQRDSLHASTNHLQPRPNLEGLQAIEEGGSENSHDGSMYSSRQSRKSRMGTSNSIHHGSSRASHLNASLLSSCGSFALDSVESFENASASEHLEPQDTPAVKELLESESANDSDYDSDDAESEVPSFAESSLASRSVAESTVLASDNTSVVAEDNDGTETEGVCEESETEPVCESTERAVEVSEAQEDDDTRAGEDSISVIPYGHTKTEEDSISIIHGSDDEEESLYEDSESEYSESDDEAVSIISGYSASTRQEDPIADSETEGGESVATSCTEGSSNNGLQYGGLSVYLSTHSARRVPTGKSKKTNSDSITATSVTEDVTSISHSNNTSLHASTSTSIDASNQSSVKTSSTNRTSRTNRTSNSAPGCLLKSGNDSQNSLCSMSSQKSELDESCVRTRCSDSSLRSTLRMVDLSRASSAPLDNSRLSKNSGNMLVPDASSVFGDDDVSIGSVDHRRRRSSRRSSLVGGVSPPPDKRGLLPSKSAIIPRSNTPQGMKHTTLLRQSSRVGDTNEKRSLRSDVGRSQIPPRKNSRGGSSLEDSSTAKTTTKSRRGVSRAKSMAMEASSATHHSSSTGGPSRRGVARAKSGHRDSFLGGSRIKKWDDSAANRSGHGLSLLERHLNEGAAKAKRPKRRPSVSQKQVAAAHHQSVASLSVASLQRMFSKDSIL